MTGKAEDVQFGFLPKRQARTYWNPSLTRWRQGNAEPFSGGSVLQRR